MCIFQLDTGSSLYGAIPSLQSYITDARDIWNGSSRTPIRMESEEFLVVRTRGEVCSIFPVILHWLPEYCPGTGCKTCFLSFGVDGWWPCALLLSLRPPPGRNHANVVYAKGEQPNKSTLPINILRMPQNQLPSRLNFLYLFCL